ncbi:hypothetical protein PEDI_17490 [Persicobacter diffluens]|uniref:Uncharacterized protein n=1 Tax=Persicobacter diffluens TaxID=981 RepID=A0AAN5AJT7_9BACT|nr:hypothetical protein PEDI_17490 [Persicobacter diffluens]
MQRPFSRPIEAKTALRGREERLPELYREVKCSFSELFLAANFHYCASFFSTQSTFDSD